MVTTHNNQILPAEGLVRLKQVLQVYPKSRSSWFQGIKDGIHPRGIKIGKRATAYDVRDIRKLIAGI